MSTTPISTDSSTDSNWFEIGGRFLGYYLGSAAMIFYTLYVFFTFGESEMGGFDDGLIFLGISLLAALAITPVIFYFDRRVFGSSIEDRLSIRGRSLAWVVLWIATGVTPVLMYVMGSILASPSQLSTDTEPAEALTTLSIYVAVMLVIAALPICTAYLLRRYWSGSFKLRSRTAVTLVLCLLVVATGVTVGDQFRSDASPDADFDGYDWETYARDPANYDDGMLGPRVNPEEDEFIRVNDSARSQAFLACSGDVAPPEDRGHGIAAAAIHNDSDQLTVAPYELRTNDNETVTVEGHYALKFRNGTAFDRSSIIDSGIYNASYWATGSDIYLPSNGDGRLVMEGVEAMSVYYDVVTPDGEVHRYTTRLCRDDGGST